jgi:hypothetical protein
MPRFIRAAAIGLLLSACAVQPPPYIVPAGPVAAMSAARPVPFRAVAPAGYCPSDDSDVVGTRLMHSLASPGSTVLGVFRPCHEPSPPSAGTPIDRLAIAAQDIPPSLVNEPAMKNRRMYLAMMADPKVWAVLGERPLALMANRTGAPLRTDSNQLEYLGADDYGAYSGSTVMPASPGSRPGGSAQLVFGTSLAGDHLLMVFGASVGLGTTEPHGRDEVQALVSELLRGTIIAAERPAQAKRTARPASP